MGQAYDKKKRILEYWSLIVLHHTGIGKRKSGSDSFYKKFFRNMVSFLSRKDKYYVSCHYLIGRNGELSEIVNPNYYIAYHAGKSSWWDYRSRKIRKWCNNFAIGIELIGDGNKEPFTDSQYQSLGALIVRLCSEFNIPLNFVVSHEMISPGRKVDVGMFFNWHRLYFYIVKEKYKEIKLIN